MLFQRGPEPSETEALTWGRCRFLHRQNAEGSIAMPPPNRINLEPLLAAAGIADKRVTHIDSPNQARVAFQPGDCWRAQTRH